MKKVRTTFVKAGGLSLALMLGACTGVEPAVMFLAATSSITMNDKLPTDYIAEGMTGKDCSYIQAQEDGGPLCRSADYGKVIEKPIYCYRTLGAVECYNEPDPYKAGQLVVQ